MKQLFLLLAVTTSLIFTSCEGDPGPPGEPGINILGQVYEVNTTLQFDPSSGTYSRVLTIPSNIEVFESDVILVYRLEKVVGAPDGGNADAWAPLPQNFFLDNGDIIQYVFNHTFFDVEIIIDGDYDPNTLSLDFTDNQVFRIAVVPSEFGDASLSMDELLETLQMDSAQVESLD
ncbi:MAG: collagen-like protein [Flavobacteriaceae bacterium]|nr:collagen-like protein [Flavobacteriaceae bacterium]